MHKGLVMTLDQFNNSHKHPTSITPNTPPLDPSRVPYLANPEWLHNTMSWTPIAWASNEVTDTVESNVSKINCALIAAAIPLLIIAQTVYLIFGG